MAYWNWAMSFIIITMPLLLSSLLHDERSTQQKKPRGEKNKCDDSNITCNHPLGNCSEPHSPTWYYSRVVRYFYLLGKEFCCWIFQIIIRFIDVHPTSMNVFMCAFYLFAFSLYGDDKGLFITFMWHLFIVRSEWDKVVYECASYSCRLS